MLVLGIDPDTNATGIALVDEEVVHAVGVVEVKGLRGRSKAIMMAALVDHAIAKFPWHQFARPDLVVVEGQQVYGRGGANANDLVTLATVSGAAISAGMLVCKNVKWPLPREWKGQQPKGVSHKRILDHYGWEYKFQGPKKPAKVTAIPGNVQVIGDVPSQHMKEVVDAIGLGLWGTRKLNVQGKVKL